MYVRCVYDTKTVTATFASAKTKVAPLQSVSMPQLEQIGAHLWSKLAHSIASVLSIPKQHNYNIVVR